MAEHPILFNGEMVRAILEGRKTQTRRFDASHTMDEPQQAGVARCMKRYGVPGDTLWVRETWRQDSRYLGGDGLPVLRYQADGKDGREIDAQWFAEKSGLDPSQDRWRSSIHMPRWASRITLEVTGVRVEWVQEISEADAIAEGLFQQCGDVHPAITQYSNGDGFWTTKPATAFCRLWDSINAKRGHGWESNPWVWVVEFRQKPEGEDDG